MPSRRNCIVAAVWTVCFVAFVALGLRAATGGALNADISLARRVQSLPDALDPLFRLENWAGDGLPLMCVTVAGAVALLFRRYRLEACLVLLTFLVRAGDVAIKHAVSEPRPSPALVQVSFPHDNLSFPSGHVIGVTLVFGLLFAYAPRLFDDRRLVLLLRGVCGVYILTIGLARIWVGAHWPSDVAGGYFYAALFLIPALVLTRRSTTVERRLRHVATDTQTQDCGRTESASPHERP